MDIIGKKNWYFLVSLLLVATGLVSFFTWGLNLSIEFTGGSRLTLEFKEKVNDKTVGAIINNLKEEGIKLSTVEKSNNLAFVRTEVVDQKQNKKFLENLKKDVGKFELREFETIGPSIGSEITANAIKALVIASILIVIYITWAFRKVPKPASSVRFGVAAIFALIHDVLITVGAFAIFGHFFGVEIDSLFVTALLTIIGFSVHDTIVVFDRIRENLIKSGSTNFSGVVNSSILETIDRSLNTSFTVVLVLLAMLLFGGETIRWFVVALLIGIVSGTYSSIFVASPLLVIWHNFRSKK
ncbi:protein translocase subunit SecF [Patescibacteria group bacterium]|nr:protein translocase subunit SecF [Patescibacteria group bacterium]